MEKRWVETLHDYFKSTTLLPYAGTLQCKRLWELLDEAWKELRPVGVDVYDVRVRQRVFCAILGLSFLFIGFPLEMLQRMSEGMFLWDTLEAWLTGPVDTASRLHEALMANEREKDHWLELVICHFLDLHPKDASDAPNVLTAHFNDEVKRDHPSELDTHRRELYMQRLFRDPLVRHLLGQLPATEIKSLMAIGLKGAIKTQDAMLSKILKQKPSLDATTLFERVREKGLGEAIVRLVATRETEWKLLLRPWLVDLVRSQRQLTWPLHAHGGNNFGYAGLDLEAAYRPMLLKLMETMEDLVKSPISEDVYAAVGKLAVALSAAQSEWDSAGETPIGDNLDGTSRSQLLGFAHSCVQQSFVHAVLRDHLLHRLDLLEHKSDLVGFINQVFNLANDANTKLRHAGGNYFIEGYSKLDSYFKAALSGTMKTQNTINAIMCGRSKKKWYDGIIGVMFHDDAHCTVTGSESFMFREHGLPLLYALKNHLKSTYGVRIVTQPLEVHKLFFCRVRDEFVRLYQEQPSEFDGRTGEVFRSAVFNAKPFTTAEVMTLYQSANDAQRAHPKTNDDMEQGCIEARHGTHLQRASALKLLVTARDGNDDITCEEVLERVASWGGNNPICIESTLISRCRVAKHCMVAVRWGNNPADDFASHSERKLTDWSYLAAPCDRSCQCLAPAHAFLTQLLMMSSIMNTCFVTPSR